MQRASETKASPSFTKEIEDRTVTGILAVTGNIDAGADIIKRGAFKKTVTENKKRIRHLWQHDFFSPPVAHIEDIREVGKAELPKPLKEEFPTAKGGLLVARTYLDTERGNEVLAGIKAGAINEGSIGFDAIKYDFETIEEGDKKGLLIRNLSEVRLWDTSDVNWGMNEATVASKAVVPFRNTGIVEEEWEATAGADVPDLVYAEMCAYHKGDVFLLEHHKLEEGNQIGAAVKAAVESCMNSLLVAQLDIPATDLRGVYNHLKSHFDQFGDQPPDFKLIELSYVVRDALKVAEGQAGSEGLFNALTMLSEQLKAEPLTALTSNWTNQIEIRKRKLQLTGG